MRRLRLTIGSTVIHAELYDTPTADALYAAAPFTSRAMTWGEEVVFTTPVQRWREADARRSVRPNELAFWVDRDAVTIELGPDRADKQDVPLSMPCNIWGRSVEDVEQLRSIMPGARILLERDEEMVAS
ncbi:MAG: hypothetical protein H6842_11430 [Rhodospirillaceae bacterium]|nr:hypothetical protein [Rhodospirillaceae bacterium]